MIYPDKDFFPCRMLHLSYKILLYFVVGSTWSGSAFVIAPNLGTKTILSQSQFEDDSSPYISWSSSSIRISHTFELFKLVILTWINHLETWLRSDNTSCYYTFNVGYYFALTEEWTQDILVLLFIFSHFTAELQRLPMYVIFI